MVQFSNDWCSLIIGFVIALFYNPKPFERKIESDPKIMAVTVSILAVVSIVLLIVLLFYRLLYGVLLRRLYANYKELKKIDL
jgi:glucan phosphoethanolaminetransferase (alkaline phosphatase superfamily)